MTKKKIHAGSNIATTADPAIDSPPVPPARTPPAPCPEHGLPLVVYKTGESRQYFKCPHDGCRYRVSDWRPIGPLKDLYGFGKSASK